MHTIFSSGGKMCVFCMEREQEREANVAKCLQPVSLVNEYREFLTTILAAFL